MDPELLQSAADAQGLPVQHFDGYSVVDHPVEGPLVVAHPPGARVPVARPDAVPPLLARAPEPPASIATTPQQQHADALRREAARQRSAYDAQRAAHDSEILTEQERRLYDDPRVIERERRFGIRTRTSPTGGTEAVGPSQAFADERALRAREADEMARYRLRHTPTSAGTTTFPDGSTVTTDDYGRSLPLSVPEGVPASWLAGPDRMEAGLREGARSLLADDAAMSERAPVTAATLPQQVADAQPSAPEASASSAPVVDGTAGAAPVAPTAAPRRLGGGRGLGGPAPMTIPGALDMVAGTPEARTAFDQTIAGLAGPHAGPRRDPDLIDRQYLVESQRAGLAARAAHTQAQIEAQAEARRQQQEQDRQRAVAGATRAYQNAIQRVADAHIEPGRWFRDQGAAGTVGATIAVALGALGQALTGSSTNSALEQINRAVEQDIDAQRSEIDAGRAAADLTGNMLAITRQEFTDRAAADDAARAAMLQQATLQVQEHEAHLSDEEARNNAEALRQQMAAQAEEAWRAALDQQSQMDLRAAQQRRLEAQAAIDERRARGGSGGMSQQRVAQTVQAMRAAHVSEEDINRYLAQHGLSSGLGEGGDSGGIPGAVQFSSTDLSPTDTTHVRSTVSGARTFVSALDEMIALRREFGSEVWDQDAVGRAAAAHEQAVSAWRNIANLGTMSDNDRRQIDEFLEDPLSMRVGVQSHLEALRDMAERAANADLYSYGYQLAATRADDQDAASIAPGARRVE